MEYTKIPESTFQQIQLNAGILVDAFYPETGEIGNLIGATTGGVSFADTIEYIDFGEDIDNCPKNMMELKKLDSHDVKISGNFVTMSVSTAKMLASAADIDENDETHIIPRNDLSMADFTEIWWIGDYSDVNDGTNAGFIAIHMLNALNTGGFQIQSTDKEKGQFAFEFTGHYSMNAQDTVPYEIYVKQGGDPSTRSSIVLNRHTLEIAVDESVTLKANTVPANAVVSWTSSATSKATITPQASNHEAVVKGISAGSTTITAKITVDSVEYSDTCTVIVTA